MPNKYKRWTKFANKKEERCEELLTYIDQCKEDLNSRTAEIPEEEKPTAYAGAVTFSGRHGFTGTYSKFGPFDAVNAKNVADVRMRGLVKGQVP